MAIIKDIFDPHILVEIKYNSSVLELLVKPRGTMMTPYSTQKLEQQSRPIFFPVWSSVSLLKCLRYVFRLNFFLLTITFTLCKCFAAHLSNCRLNLGCLCLMEVL